MLSFQLMTVSAVFMIASVLTWRFIRVFRQVSGVFLPLFALLLLFCVGFSLRLMEDKAFVDAGYFLTELSLIWGIVLYTSTLILGQVRYWEK